MKKQFMFMFLGLLLISGCASNPVLDLTSALPEIKIFRENSSFESVRSEYVYIGDIEAEGFSTGFGSPADKISNDSAIDSLVSKAKKLNANAILLKESKIETNYFMSTKTTTLRGSAFKKK